MFHGTLICERIAEKLSDPNEVLAHVAREEALTTRIWQEESLVAGLPGIAYFYAAMHRAFPEQSWDVVRDSYLGLSLEFFQNKLTTNCSVFNGLSGLGAAIYASSENGKRHQVLLSKLDAYLIEEVNRTFLSKTVYRSKNEPIPPHFYNLSQGICGVISYLLMRKDNPILYKLAHECIEILAQLLLTNIELNGKEVPSWYTPSEFLWYQSEKNQYPNGCFLLSLPFGITGCLALLSLASLEGFRIPCLSKTIYKIAIWLKNAHLTMTSKGYWRCIIDSDPSLLNPELDKTQVSWGGGWSATLRSLFLASKALGDTDLSEFTCENYYLMLNNTQENNTLVGPSFCFGDAGFLLTSYLMANESSNPKLLKKIPDLERKLILSFDPEAPFGFFAEHMDEKRGNIKANDPGLLHGAAGIGLSLLIALQKIEPSYSRIFLLG